MDLLPSVQDKQEKQFIFRHSRSVFELLDADGSNNISAEEFESFGFLFNFERRAVWQIFREFDVSGDQVNMIYTNGWLLLRMSKKVYKLRVNFQELDYQEFKMFAMACIDRQNEIEQKKRQQGSEGDATHPCSWCTLL